MLVLAHRREPAVSIDRLEATRLSRLAPGLWKRPRNKSTEYTKLKFWMDLARLREENNFHSLFIADILGAYDSYKGPENHRPALEAAAIFPVNDPMYIVPAMAIATRNLAFGVTASTTYEKPDAPARKFSSLDHLTEGRIAWNIVTSYLDSAAKNLGLNTQVDHDERYRIADAYMEVVYKLWEGSWRDDAVVKNVKTGIYAMHDRVRQINHAGNSFTVPGPHICEPSPQRIPFLFQAGTSKSGRAFGAKHAEAILVEEAEKKRKETVPGAGNLKWTKAKIAEYLRLGSIFVKAVGSPKTVVDIMERWVEVADVDGFNLYNLVNPGSYEDIIKWVLPELRRRVLFLVAVEKEGLTTREAFLGAGKRWLQHDHPGMLYKFIAEDAEIELSTPPTKRKPEVSEHNHSSLGVKEDRQE
ncbi:bacterial luciferase-like protein [Thozetella sp. PMI_491]|nr:bacterial luciferase-like protein [Thozetella sp. PMI_491]